MESKMYDMEGKEAGKIMLPEAVFGVPWNADLVHQVVVSMQANARIPVAHAKDRSEQRGGGRKPWRQKGTGRARHGSRRSPLWRGGGVTFGPRKEKDYSKKINKKMRVKALYAVLSKKFEDNEIVFLDQLSMEKPHTRQAKAVISALAGIKGWGGLTAKKRNAALFALPERNDAIFKSFRNIGTIALNETKNLNPVDVLTFKYLVIVNPSQAVPLLEARSVSPKSAAGKTRENKLKIADTKRVSTIAVRRANAEKVTQP